MEAGQRVPEAIFKMDRSVLENATAVSSVSKYTAQKTAEYLRYDKDIAVIYNGIDMTSTAPVTREANKVVFSGSLVPKKGIYQLIKAWNRVNKEIPAAQLYIYGKGPVDKIKEGIDPAAISSIYFEGHVPRTTLLSRLASATLAIFPSYAESFGLAPVEAMSCGTAVIFSNRTSGPEIVQDGVTGLLVDPDNIEEIARKIIFLLEHPAEAAQMAEKGKYAAIERFDIKTIAQKNIEYYRVVLGA
jgi:glycosyltransferase involved in cell wall biosynthesis